MKIQEKLRYLEDRWDERVASALDEAELLRYRSNLLGSDLRITNFGGGNTSSKIAASDPFDGSPKNVLWIKGSGGDIGSIQRTGFATLYLDKLLSLTARYRGVDSEDEMVAMYPLCAFGNNAVAASIDTPLHAFLPFKHIDHLHPDWGIALAAAANGREKMEEFNRAYSHKLIWLPWQRPGFELAMMLRDAVESSARLRWSRSRWPRNFHLGKYSARMLRQHDHDHRSARPIYFGSRGKARRKTIRRQPAPDSRKSGVTRR